ncbi:hypothetical protein HII31_04338 [Pseudocercospora fuligena]|uniref:Uncharacterized protein n=1 Tax=Pseudocercospora fuligena TaxID=685502 RepID=A0A8H6VJT9_9PEZI|nr:hypothetical protein HII31_04338 [Pseudocercospora fuligena]
MSDQKVEEQIASTGGAPGELNAAPAEASVNEPSATDKPAAEADVAGREKKGTPGGFFKKLMFWKKDKKPEEPPKKEEAKASTQEAVTGTTTA